MSEQIADVLDDAADHIEKYGHLQDEGHGEGPVEVAPACSVGALNLATALRDSLRKPAADALRGVLGGQNIVSWNDTPGRTKQEVLDALRLAAKEQRMAGESA